MLPGTWYSADSCEASFYARRAFVWSFDRPQKLQRVGSRHFPGWDQPTPDPTGRLMGQGRGYEGAGALGNVVNEGLSWGTKGAKGGDNECDHSHASAGGGPPGGAKVVARTGNL